jgi:hypothetical protein
MLFIFSKEKNTQVNESENEPDRNPDCGLTNRSLVLESDSWIRHEFQQSDVDEFPVGSYRISVLGIC